MNLTALTMNILFYCFSGVLLFSGLMLVSSRNAVRAALFLVLAFFAASALWILMQAEFLALILLLVYVGAVMTLFLFMIMMLNIDKETVKKGFVKHYGVGGLVVVLAVVMMVTSLHANHSGLSAVAALPLEGAKYSNVKELGAILYTQYFYPFEIAGVLLLFAMVAAIALTHRQQRNSKKQDPSKQVLVNPRDRIRVIKMNSEERQ